MIRSRPLTITHAMFKRSIFKRVEKAIRERVRRMGRRRRRVCGAEKEVAVKIGKEAGVGVKGGVEEAVMAMDAPGVDRREVDELVAEPPAGIEDDTVAMGAERRRKESETTCRVAAYVSY